MTFYGLRSSFSCCLLAIVLSGCSWPGGEAARKPPSALDKTAAVPAAPPVLAEAECANPKVRVQITEAVRSGPESITLKFRLLNPDATAPVNLGEAFADGPADAGSLSGVSVLDAAGQKQVFVLRDDRGQPQCSTGLGALPPRGQLEAWARYPVPVAGATRVTVVFPGLPAFRDVPIADAPHGTGAAGPSY